MKARDIELTVLETCYISSLMDELKLSLKDIKKEQIKGNKKTQKELAVCEFHYKLHRLSNIFDYEMQAKLFNLEYFDLRRRVHFHQKYKL